MPNWLRKPLEPNKIDGTNVLPDDKCVIGIGINEKDGPFIIAHITPGYEKHAAKIVVGLVSGQATKDIFEAIKANCEETGANPKIFSESVIEMSTEAQQSFEHSDIYIRPSEVGTELEG